MSFEIPILLIAFNRPETTKKVIDSLRLVKPSKIYVSVDAPRLSKGAIEKIKNKEVIRIINEIDWHCRLEIICPEQNLGCKLNMSRAISHVFKYEDKLIVIEDDIVAAPAFFTFAEEMLEKYKYEAQIGIITANNYTPITSDEDYYFSKYTHIWGWALWKRTWSDFDVNLGFLKGINVMEVLKGMNLSFSEYSYMAKYYAEVKQKVDSGVMNAWGPQFFLYNFLNGLLTVTPKSNLAMNIGVESSRIESREQFDVHFRPIDNEFKVRVHPAKIQQNEVYDRIHFRNHINYRRPYIVRIISKLKRIIF